MNFDGMYGAQRYGSSICARRKDALANMPSGLFPSCAAPVRFTAKNVISGAVSRAPRIYSTARQVVWIRKTGDFP